MNNLRRTHRTQGTERIMDRTGLPRRRTGGGTTSHRVRITASTRAPIELALVPQAVAGGASDDEALAQFTALRAEHSNEAEDEEVYRALIARSARR